MLQYKPMFGLMLYVPINNFFSLNGTFSGLNQYYAKMIKCVLLMETTSGCHLDSNPKPLGHKSVTLPTELQMYCTLTHSK